MKLTKSDEIVAIFCWLAGALVVWKCEGITLCFWLVIILMLPAANRVSDKILR